MKKTTMYAMLVAILDVIAAYSVLSSNIDPTAEEYKNYIAQAEDYEEQQLYYRSISCYAEALDLRESYDLRMKIAELYGKGYENGEISTPESQYSVLSEALSYYPDKTECYDMIIGHYESLGNYSACAEYVRLAHENGVDSETIRRSYDTVKTIYSETLTGYDTVTDMGGFIEAKKAVITKVDKVNEDGEVIYTEDENGNTTAVQEERPQTEYTYLYYDDSDPVVYTTVNMSPPVAVSFADGNTATMIFNKGYGNDIASGELSNEIYSRLETNGIRTCYIGENNEYEAASSFNNQRIVLYNTLTGKYDVFSTAGKMTAQDYDKMGSYANGVAYAEKDGSKMIVDPDGKSVLKKNISDVILGHGERCSYFNRMFVRFEGEERFKMINTENMSEMNFECDDADLFFGETAAFKRDGKYGFVDMDGKVVTEPFYEGAKSFSNGYAAVKQDGKWGYINRNGEMVIPPVYDDALYMDSTGEAFVYKDGSWWIVSLFYVE